MENDGIQHVFKSRPRMRSKRVFSARLKIIKESNLKRNLHLKRSLHYRLQSSVSRSTALFRLGQHKTIWSYIWLEPFCCNN